MRDEHVLARAELEDDVVDAGVVEQLAEQEARDGPAPMIATCVRIGSVEQPHEEERDHREERRG